MSTNKPAGGPGSRFGEYVLDRQVGAGSAGQVFAAHHAETMQPVALKLLHSDVQHDEMVERRFVREVAILQKLNHPNIVRFYEGGIEDSSLFYTMELLDCGSLKEVLQRRERLSWQEAVECGIQISRALQHAHAAGIIHRDLKPANIFLSGDGLLKLGDFGIARDNQREGITAKGQTVGTYRYMAPEQIRGESGLTAAVDMYALGCLLFEMMTGSVPYDGRTIPQIFDQHLDAAIPSVRDKVPSCPPALETLITRLMAKQASERLARAEVVGDELRRILEDEATATAHAERPNSREKLDRVEGLDRDEKARPNLSRRLLSSPTSDHSEINSRVLLIAFAVAVVVICVLAVVWR